MSLKTKVIGLQEGITRLAQKSSGIHEVFAMYSSVLGGVTVEKPLMSVNVDDHIFSRGHSCFDTCNISNGRAYGLDFHLDRFMNSAKRARIDLSKAAFLEFEENPAEQKKKLKEIILNTCAVAGHSNGVYCRFWLSAGRGDFSITPSKLVEPVSLYVVVHSSATTYEDSLQRLEEATVDVPLKNIFLATLKSTNYLINALCAMQAQEKTKNPMSIGLQLDSEGNVAEFSIAAIAIVCKDRVLRTPTQHKILASTTLQRVMGLANEILIPQGLLTGVEFSTLSIDDVMNADEVLQLGGGHVSLVTKLDGQEIGSDDRVAKVLHELLMKEQREGESQFLDEIPFDAYGE